MADLGDRAAGPPARAEPAGDEIAVEDLFDICSALGGYHQVEGKKQFLCVQRDESLTNVQNLETMITKDPGRVRARLGEWQVLTEKLVPLFTAYEEDTELGSHVLHVLVLLTTRVGDYGPPPSSRQMHQEQERDQLRHLQDYKEAFTKPLVFSRLVRLLAETLDGEAANARVFKDVLFLLRNLVSVPDPGPGDAGCTPLRRRMQLTFIRNLSEEGVLAFFLFLGQLLTSQDDSQQVWALADIVYHICAHFDPEELLQKRKEQSKSDLSDLLARDKADTKLIAPASSRHSRFGTSMQTWSVDGSLNLSSSVFQNSIIQKGSELLKREFRNPDFNGKKENVFHNVFFVDLREGSVREHNQVNPHVRGSLDDRTNHTQKILQGYRPFFEQLCSTYFSSLVTVMRTTCNVSTSTVETMAGTEFNMLHLVNFVSWFLEFHRCQHAKQVAESKRTKAEPPDMDIAVIQGAIDLDMIQFTTARLRELGKVEKIHSSLLVMVLRVLSQQLQTIKVMTECTGSDTRDCGDILVVHLVKEDVLGNISWVMKNFNSSVNDPRVLSYSVEVWHNLTMLMKKLQARGQADEWQVERTRGNKLHRSTTSEQKEVAGLADSRVVENLFHLLEKYRRHTPLLQTMLVELIQGIMDAEPTNIVLFFELSYFMRIQRIMTDPLLTSAKHSVKHKDLIGLLRFILRQFFTCAASNSCAFAELFFRKVQEGDKNESAEFAGILSNYEDERYAHVLDRIGAGDTVAQMRLKQREMLRGQLEWTEEEDNVLRERYSMYADHPLCADLLAAELPEDSRRTSAQVRKRLVELGLVAGRGRAGAGQEDGQPPSKKSKVEDVNLEMPAEGTSGKASAPASPGTPKRDAMQQEEEMLEEDLERLLDAAFDSLPTRLDGSASAAPPATAMDTASTAIDQSNATNGSAGAQEEDSLEVDLARLIDEEMPPTTAVDQSNATHGSAGAQEEDSLEKDLERLIDEEMPPTTAIDQSNATHGSAGAQDTLEMELERLIDGNVPTTEP